ncbi:MAG: DUF5989 family protein, partial [Bacteroidales bacterium]|nr:DUF5989 family protein [Bacteroidales bacterium]
RDLWFYIIERKRYWLAPVIIALLLLGFLVIFGTKSAFGPFIYSLF